MQTCVQQPPQPITLDHVSQSQARRCNQLQAGGRTESRPGTAQISSMFSTASAVSSMMQTKMFLSASERYSGSEEASHRAGSAAKPLRR